MRPGGGDTERSRDLATAASCDGIDRHPDEYDPIDHHGGDGLAGVAATAVVDFRREQNGLVNHRGNGIGGNRPHGHIDLRLFRASAHDSNQEAQN